MKPTKPHPDFPLFPHSNGQWAKKVKGKLRYYGQWVDPAGALARYREESGDATPVSDANQASPGRVSAPTKIPSKGGRRKPTKPHKDFPLYAHSSGRWAKKIRGKLHYFGPWADPAAALAKYLDQKDDLLAGRTPDATEGLTVRDLVNRFLTSKKRLVDCGEIDQRTWNDYDIVCRRVLKVFGTSATVRNLRPADFENLRTDFAKSHGPVALTNDIIRVKVLFNYAFNQDLIDRPAKFGEQFKPPSKAVLRKARQKKGPRMFSADDLRKIIEAAGTQMKAMILLGANCGFGNNDCAKLTRSAIDLENGWVSFSRPKTGIERRCPLWPETVAALKAAIDSRPMHKNEEHAARLFITKYGQPWEPKAKCDSPISKEMVKILKELNLHRPGLAFYALRHTFQTIGEKSRDKDAVRAIMGHAAAANDMSAVYNEEQVSDDRLRAVADFVRDWLFNKTELRLAS